MAASFPDTKYGNRAQGTAQPPSRARWVAARPVSIFSVLVLITVFVTAYVTLTNELRAANQPSPFLTLVRDAAPDVIVVLVAYLVVNYVLYRHQLQNADAFATALVARVVDTLGGERGGIKHVFTEPARIDWGTLIDSASDKIVIVARCWDDAATLYRSALARFFQRGGELTLCICDPTDEAAVTVAAQHRSADQPPEPRQIKWRIYRTITEIEAARRLAAKKDMQPNRIRKRLSAKFRKTLPSQFELRYLTHAVNSEWIWIDERDLVLLPQSHFFLPEAQCPAFWFDLAWADGMGEFVRSELEGFERKRSSPGDVREAVEIYQAMRRENPIEVPEPPSVAEESGQSDVKDATP